MRKSEVQWKLHVRISVINSSQIKVNIEYTAPQTPVILSLLGKKIFKKLEWTILIIFIYLIYRKDSSKYKQTFDDFLSVGFEIDDDGIVLCIV